MKSLPKILIVLFLSVFILQIIALFFLLAAPVASQAADISLASPVTNQAKNMQFTPQVTIPGYSFDPKSPGTGNIANLVKAIYNYAIGIIGILAAVVLMIGGVLWIVAGGNTTQIGEAKAWIGAALTGLVLALTSYLILSTINPALVDLKTSEVPGVAELKTGCCITKLSAEQNLYEDNTSKDSCAGDKKTWQEEKCPLPKSCCASNTRCADSIEITEQLCKDTIAKEGLIFNAYLPKGRCAYSPVRCLAK